VRRGIKAERLVMKLAVSSSCVHGPDHDCTVCADERKMLYVLVMPEMKLFQALHYKDDGETCVVTGPATKPRSCIAI